MTKITHHRISPPGYPITIGYFILGGQLFYTLEPPETFVVSGTYVLKRGPATKNLKAGIDTAFFFPKIGIHTAVEWGHIGNYLSDTSGCALFGLGLDNVIDKVTYSGQAIKNFFELIGDETEIELTVIGEK